MLDQENKTLMGITSKAMALASRITSEAMENEGEISEITELQILENDSDLVAKVEGYNVVIAQLELQAKFLKSKEDAIYKVRKSLEDQVKFRKETLKEAMIRLEVDRLDGVNCYYKLSKGKNTLSIEDQSKIPDEFKKTITTVETIIDKEKIIENLEMGFTVEGARFKQSRNMTPYIKKG